MADIKTWSSAAASNNSASPDGAPEGWAPADVNNWGREVMAAVRRQHEQAEWIELGFSISRATATSFKLEGDRTGDAVAGRRLRADDGGSLLYGEIESSTFTTDTNVTVLLDSGSLTSSLSGIAFGMLTPGEAEPVTWTGNKRITGTLAVGSDFSASAALEARIDSGDSVIRAARVGGNSVKLQSSSISGVPTIATGGNNPDGDLNLDLLGSGVFQFQGSAGATTFASLGHTGAQINRTDASFGRTLTLYNGAVNSINRTHVLSFQGQDDLSATVAYGAIQVRVLDAGANSHDGEVNILTNIAGSVGTTTARFHEGLAMASLADKGSGTIHGQEIWENGTQICYVFDAALDGAIDQAKWDKVAPSGHHAMAAAFTDRFDRDLDPERYADFWKQERHLPAMPAYEDYEGSHHVGGMIARLWETVEVQAVHIEKLRQRIESLRNYVESEPEQKFD